MARSERSAANTQVVGWPGLSPSQNSRKWLSLAPAKPGRKPRFQRLSA
jgi:hypothetical protein